MRTRSLPMHIYLRTKLEKWEVLDLCALAEGTNPQDSPQMKLIYFLVLFYGVQETFLYANPNQTRRYH